MNQQAVAELGFKPGALGRHNLASVGDVHELIEGGRIHGKGAGAFTAIDALHEFAETTDATDKVDALGSTRIVNVEERLQHELLEESHIEAVDRTQVLEELVLERASIPLAAHVEVHLVLLSRALHARQFFDVEHKLHFFHELFRRAAVQVLKHAVVVQNLELGAREEDSEVTVVFFVARVLRILFGAVAGSASTSSTAVVTVSDVAHRNFFEGLADSFDFSVIVDDAAGTQHTRPYCSRPFIVWR